MNRRRSRSGATTPAVAALLLLAAFLASASQPARAQEQAEPVDWNLLIERYSEDPVGTRDALLKEASGRMDQLDPPQLIFVADAHLRRDETAAATRILNRVIEEAPAEFYTPYAYVGLGAIDARSGDLQRARTQFQKAAELSAKGPSEIHQLSTLLAGQTAAAMGNYDEALEVLGVLASSNDVGEGIRQAASFGRASTLMASGRDAEAVAAFDQIAAQGSFATDARYGAALARLDSGESEAARQALDGLAAACPEESDGPRVSRQLRGLEPEAVLLAWIRNYKNQPFDSFQSTETLVFSVQGCDLARTTLARLDPEEGAPPAPVAPAATAEPPQATASPMPSPSLAPIAAAPSGPGSGWSPVALLFLAAAAILLLLAWLWRRG